jgi:hypothetical protein
MRLERDTIQEVFEEAGPKRQEISSEVRSPYPYLIYSWDIFAGWAFFPSLGTWSSVWLSVILM